MDKKDIDRLKYLLISLSRNGITFYDSKIMLPQTQYEMKMLDAAYKPHAHNHLEIVCLLEGCVSIYINGRWYIESPGNTKVFLPGTVHGECYVASEKPYCMLWLTILPLAIKFHISTYSPKDGYSMKRLYLSPPIYAKLWAIYHENNLSKNELLQVKFHYLLMDSLYYILDNDLIQDADVNFYHGSILQQVKHYIENHYSEDLSLQLMAAITHYSPHYLNILFKKHFGYTLYRYINEVRLNKAKDLLEHQEMLIKDVATAVGFSDQLYFSRKFKQFFGVNPQEYKASLSIKQKEHNPK